MRHHKKILISALLLPLFFFFGCPPEPDPLEEPGAFAVYRATATAPNPENPADAIEVGFYAPSTDGGESIADGQFEMVVLMHGFSATYQSYEAYATHLASYGFIVVGMNFVIPSGLDGHHDYLARQTTYVLDYALGEQSPVAGHVDSAKVAAAGHSLGGKIGFYAAAIDTRISVVMAMDPSNSGGAPCYISPEFCNAYPVAPNPATGEIGVLDDVDAASFIMRAEPDVLFNPDPNHNAWYFFYGSDGQGMHAVGSPALYFDMGGASHVAWLINSDVKRITRRTLTAWLLAYFRGEDREAYFTGEVIQEDMESGFVVGLDAR